MANRRVPRAVGAVFVVALAAGCGGGSTPASTGASTTAGRATTTAVAGGAPNSASGSFTTLNGAHYKVTVAVGPRPAGGAVLDCAPAARAGATPLPVVVTVANEGTAGAAPFPPLRVELVKGADTPVPVPVKTARGTTCDFAPRQSELPAATLVTFKGATPPLDDAAAPGSAGQVQVSVSESTFSVSVPVP